MPITDTSFQLAITKPWLKAIWVIILSEVPYVYATNKILIYFLILILHTSASLKNKHIDFLACTILSQVLVYKQWYIVI